MNSSLTAQQRKALDEYEVFKNRYPQLFAGHQQRPIVRDRAQVEAYASEHGDVLGIAASTRYAYFVVDLVESTKPNGERLAHPYFRVIYRKQLDGAANAVVVATIAESSLGNIGDIVLVEQERHATGNIEIELPRGFGELGLSGEQNALQELREETGFIGKRAELLGTTLTDSGLTNAEVAFYHVKVVARESREPEVEEAITGIRTVSLHQLKREIAEGRVRDGFTLQALTLFENRIS